VVLSGTSAGCICWFEGCITDSLPEQLLPLECTGFLKGSACSHYDARPDRPREFRRYLLEGRIPSPGFGAEDHTGLHFIDTKLHAVVSAVPGKQVYRLEARAGEIIETPLAVRSLAAPAAAVSR